MTESIKPTKQTMDPLGLRELLPLDPPSDGWEEIQAALERDANNPRHGRWRMTLVATAACLLVIAGVVLRTESPRPVPAGAKVATNETHAASIEQAETLNELIVMSQSLEQKLRRLRSGSGPIPATSAVYVAELEDLVAQVDNQISAEPDSINLWGQRVNLLLDLAQLYQQQWEQEYGRMASR
jgi:hypothetical protein